MHCRSSKYETLVGDKYPYKQAGLPVFSPWIGPAHPLTAFTDSGLLNGFFILFLFVIILVSARAVNQTNSVSVLLGLYALNITLIVWPYQPTGHTFLFLKLKPLKLSLDCLFWLPPLWDCDDVLLSISLDSISFAFSPQNNTDTSKLSTEEAWILPRAARIAADQNTSPISAGMYSSPPMRSPYFRWNGSSIVT